MQHITWETACVLVVYAACVTTLCSTVHAADLAASLLA